MSRPKNILVVNATPEETRVALLEDGRTSELYIERAKDRGYVGNIYKGRVLRVLPGMQAAFVDIGLERSAFLYVGDIIHKDPMAIAERHEEDEHESHIKRRGEKNTAIQQSSDEDEEETPQEGTTPIEELLEEGQEILVQVIKDPLGTKGCRLSTHITIPGRHIVYMPFVEHIGVSKRISDQTERTRLAQILRKFKTSMNFNGGLIARTASEGASVRKLRNDVELLLSLWEEIRERARKRKAPELLYSEPDLPLRAARDLFTSDVDRLIVDDEHTYKRIIKFIERFLPKLKSQVELYKGEEPIFDFYGIELEINRALGRKVWLKSGGYIVIDQTEALTAIDVNTGRFTGHRNLEDTILKTNLEAVREIAEQLRLRNIGGIIIIDFIDMQKEANKQRVIAALREELKKDKAKTHVSEITELGLVQMTRKRVRESIGHILCEPCFYCDGKGYLKSKTTICYEIFREIEREAPNIAGDTIVVNAHPEICDMLSDEESAGIARLEEKTGKKILLRSLPYFHIEQYEIVEKHPYHNKKTHR